MKAHKSLFFICAVFVMLTALCLFFPADGVQVFGTTLRFPSLHKVLVREKGPDIDELLRKEEQQRLEGLRDSVAYYRNLVDSSSLRFWFPHDDPSFFDTLFAQLDSAQAQGRTIRILHYGDSQIEMDRMTAQLRSYMQAHFGGGGPGMLPFCQTIHSITVNQYASGALSMQSSYGDSLAPRANGNYGPMARCHHVGGSATAGVSASKHKEVDERAKHFSQLTLLFNNRPGALAATFTDRDGGYTNQQENREPGVHAFTWHLDSSSTSLRLSLQGDADVYAMMVDDGPGVAVDNIALRGCSGQQFCMINADQLAAAYSHMDIGLIILQFGGNSVPYIRNQKALDTYCESLGRQIDRIHECCPKALVLFVGPSDMSTSVGGELQSYPFLPTMIDGLRQTANAHGAAYWSIYHAMGGHNSMVAWVNNGLAGTDYIHFSNKGVAIMGNYLADAFNNMYELYKFRREIPKAQFDSIWRSQY